MKNNFRLRGFTIIELMITVSIIGVLAAFAMPNFTYSIQNNRVKTAASDMHTSMLLARSEAIKRNDNVDLVPITGGWQVEYDENDDDVDVMVLMTKNDVPSDVSVDCNTDNDPSTLETCPAGLIFNRSGRPDIFLELRFTHNTNTLIPLRCVTMSLSGRPKVETDSDSDATNGCN